MALTMKDLSVGSQLLLGRYYPRTSADPQEILWIKTGRDGRLITKTVVDVLAFDASEIQENGVWRNGGNPKYGLSNLFQFLNSDMENWYVKQHERDEPPYYRDHYGFLREFSRYEKDCLVPFSTVVGDNDIVTSRVSLPTLDDICGENKMSYFKRHGVRPIVEDDCAFRMHNVDARVGGYADFWISTERSSRYNDAGIINRSGYADNSTPCKYHGVRPVVMLRESVEVEPVPGLENTYRVKCPAQEPEMDITSFLGIA